MSPRLSTAVDISDMSVTCLPTLRCAAEKSEKPSTKFCMSSIVWMLRLLLLVFENSSTKS